MKNSPECQKKLVKIFRKSAMIQRNAKKLMSLNALKKTKNVTVNKNGPVHKNVKENFVFSD